VRRAERAFTLFEVLAAVAILGILYTTLISWAMDALLAEGVSKRRLQASLVADRHLAELELELDAGIVPPIGEEETESDAFRIVVSVQPFDLVLPDSEPGSASSPVLVDLTSDGLTPIREIQIRVIWLEAETEFEVVRAGFAVDTTQLDTSALQATLPTTGSQTDAAAESAP
jgi:prepilin-type N-terminal cleavage/methylation domain-containing protein